MHRQTVIVKAPRSFVEQVLWPEFQELSGALSACLAEITEKLIREEVHGETADAEERESQRMADATTSRCSDIDWTTQSTLNL